MIAGAVLALAAAVAGAVALAFHIVAAERERELRGWQDRLAIVADSRAAAVEAWLERQLAVVGGLAQNASLQVYMTELALARGDRSQVTDAIGQAEYLRNLLDVTADRTGFAGVPAGPRVNANVRRAGTAGLALLDAEGRVLVATPDMPAIEGRLRAFVATAPAGERAVLDMHVGASGRPQMAFIAPVVGVQADPGTARIGSVLGVRTVDAELFDLLRQPPVAEKTSEALLVRRADAVIEYLSPLLDGSAPLQRRIAADTAGLAAGFALGAPGGFALRRDYRDVEVLVTGRRIAAAPWVLVQKVDRAEALAASDSRLDRLLILMLLAIAALAAAFVAVWRHAVSRRSAAAAARLAELADRLDRQARLLRVVTDSQPAAIFIADADGRLRFANRTLAERVGTPADALVGKTLESVFGPAAALRYRKSNREALERGTAQPSLERIGAGAGQQILRAEHVPLAPGSGEGGGVLVVEEDITLPIVERERRERTLRHLVRTLVALLDRRDPFAANHSQRVAAVARRIAEEMGLEAVEIETAEIAGNLMNLGKIMVPPELLTRSGQLTGDEMRQVRRSLQAGADLLEGIEFDGPVVATLRQAQERWDGAGPAGLAGERILVTARIVAVANAFVAMVSPRAHRPGADIDRAIAALQAEAGAAFDRRVVAALVNDLENRGGRARWADFVGAAG